MVKEGDGIKSAANILLNWNSPAYIINYFMLVPT